MSILQPKLWERASGTSTRLLKFVQPPQTFDESVEFDHEIELADRLQNKSGRSFRTATSVLSGDIWFNPSFSGNDASHQGQ